VLDYLRKRTWDNKLVSQFLLWMSDNQATGEEAADHFLRTNRQV